MKNAPLYLHPTRTTAPGLCCLWLAACTSQGNGDRVTARHFTVGDPFATPVAATGAQP